MKLMSGSKAWVLIIIFFSLFFRAEVCNAQQWGGSSTILNGIYRNGYINVEGLYVTRYGSSLAGDPNPFTLSSTYELGEDHDLSVYGSGTQKLHFRLVDGDFKVGAFGTPNASIYNDGMAYFMGSLGVGTSIPQKKLHISGTADVEQWIEATDNGYASLTLKSNGKKWHWSKRPSSEQESLRLYFHDGTIWSSAYMSVLPNGNVGIGSTNPDARLTVNGDIHTKEVRVDLTVPAPDYVFDKDYDLLPLSEVEAYINQNKHLPEVPSAKKMEADGLNLKEMNLILLKKIEELTLHLIEMKKDVVQLQKDNQNLKIQVQNNIK